MAISTTTFEERLARINSGATVDVAAKVGQVIAPKRSLRARLLTFPCLVGLSILTGGTAYAWAATTQTDVTWIMALNN